MRIIHEIAAAFCSGGRIGRLCRAVVVIAALLPLSVSAQTYPQRGRVRMITSSATEPITPVAGVRVVVGNNLSPASDEQGAFTVRVPQQFEVNGVAPDEYLLTLPTKGRTYYHSANEIDVVVTTKSRQEADYKRLYLQLKRKYREQTNELNELRQTCKDRLDELSTVDADYACVKGQYDSLQRLYTDYLNHESKIDEEIRRISRDLSLTDYQTLDSVEKRTYELKCAGEWKQITDFLREVMQNDVEAFIRTGLDKEARSEAALQSALEAREQRFALVLSHVESFKMQHLNDSVACYYRLLTTAAPQHGGYLIEAGDFEYRYRADYAAARDYYERAIATQPADTLLATSYDRIGRLLMSQAAYAQALSYYRRALDLRLSSRGKQHADVAVSYVGLGDCYLAAGELAPAKSCYQEALNIARGCAEHDVALATCYAGMGRYYATKGDYRAALSYDAKAKTMYQALFGESDPVVAMLYDHIGLAYLGRNEFNQAQTNFLKAAEMQVLLLGESHPDLAATLFHLGLLYGRCGDEVQARAHLERALAIARPTLGEHHPLVTDCLSALSDLPAMQSE